MFVAEKKSIAMSLLFPPVSCSLTSSIKSKPLTKCQHFFGRTDSTMTDPSQPRPPGSYFRAPLTAQAVLNKAKHTVPAFCTPALIYLQNVYISVQLYLCKFAESWILHFTGRSLAYRPHSTVSLCVPRPGLPQPGLCVFTEGGCLFELQPWVQLTSSVCMCPLHPPPQQQRQQGQDPSIKQSWMGPCEATFPSFWTWYLLSADSGLFKGSQHSCRPPQIWDKAALAAPTTHTHTHPHTLTHIQYTSGQTHLQPLSCMCVFVCWHINDLALTFNNAAVVQYIGESNH